MVRQAGPPGGGSRRRPHGRRGPIQRDDLQTAIERLVRLLDTGLTPRKLAVFMRRYEGRETNFRQALADCIRLIGAPPVPLIEALGSALASKAAAGRGLGQGESGKPRA